MKQFAVEERSPAHYSVLAADRASCTQKSLDEESWVFVVSSLMIAAIVEEQYVRLVCNTMLFTESYQYPQGDLFYDVKA